MYLLRGALVDTPVDMSVDYWSSIGRYSVEYCLMYRPTRDHPRAPKKTKKAKQNKTKQKQKKQKNRESKTNLIP